MISAFSLALSFLNDRYDDLFFSPYVVPVAACVAGLGCVAASLWAGVRRREMQSQERLAAIAAGQPIPPTLEELAIIHGRPVNAARRSDGRGSRRAGIVLISVAFGFIAFFAALAAILQVRPVLAGAAVGLIPLLIGIGFLIDAHVTAREAAAETSLDGPASPPALR